MKQYTLLFALILGICCLGAQEIHLWQHFRHSSRDDAGNIHIRWDNLANDVLNQEFYAKRGGGAWQSYPITHLSDGSSSAQPNFSWNMPLSYRLRAEQSYEGVAAAVMHPAWLLDESFPPMTDDLAFIGTDVFGDSLTVYDPNLDLGDTWMGCTDDKLFFAMQNLSNDFPTMNSFTSYNAYGCAIANPDAALADSTIFAMVYANVLGLISPGLYKIGIDAELTPSFDRIGDIQSIVSGGKLYLACNLSDLTNDPSFGEWPNFTNTLAFSALTMKLDINLSTMEPDVGIGDYSMPGIVIFEKHEYQASGNTVPQVTELKIENNLLSFFYSDDENDFPLVCKFINQNGEEIHLESNSYDYFNGVTFSGISPSEIISGELLVSDNNIDFQRIEYEPTSNSEDLLPTASLACNIPNPILRGSKLNIKLSNLTTDQLELHIYNIRGQKLWSWKGYADGNNELSLHWDANIKGKAAPAGVYLLKAKNAKTELSKKFSIIR